MKDEIVNLRTISEMHEFYGYEKPKHPLLSIIDYTKLRPEIKESGFRYNLSFYIISYKLFDGVMKYGKSNYDFTEGTLMFASPLQTISASSGYELKEGWGLYIHPDLVNGTSLGRVINAYSFFQYEANEALHISEEEKQILDDCINRIKKEYSQNIDKHTQELIISNIELLLNYCTRFYDRQFFTRAKISKDVVQRFENLLNEYFQRENLMKNGLPDVKYFANKLNLSPNYLSDLLSKYTGKTTQEHIHLHTIEKAKSLLWSTEYSISEIAYQLGFEHPSHFSKMFKSKIGVSPKEFRSQN